MPKSYYTVGRIVERIKRKELSKTLKDFVYSTRPSRFPGTKGHKESVPWLLNKLKSIGTLDSQISIEEFEPDINYGIARYGDDFNIKIKTRYKAKDAEFIKWKNFTDNIQSTLKSFNGLKGTNVIWEKKGSESPEKVLILGAHFDTIAYDKKNNTVLPNSPMPGADDNGTGVVTLLTLIEILNQLSLPKTVRIIFFDFQELGFLGSRYYTTKHKEDLIKNTKGYINVEMLGNDTKSKDKDKQLRNFKAYIRPQQKKGHESDKSLAEFLLKAGKKSRSGMNFVIDSNNSSNSDQVNFWALQIPSIAFTQNMETDYNSIRHHSLNDFPESINIKSFHQAFKFIAASVISWSFDIIR